MSTITAIFALTAMLCSFWSLAIAYRNCKIYKALQVNKNTNMDRLVRQFMSYPKDYPINVRISS